jgi:hypothetical protein
METKQCLFSINKNNFSINVKSKKFIKKTDLKLFNSSLFNNKQLLTDGFCVKKIPNEWFYSIKENIKNFIENKIKSFKHINNFNLEKYHEFVDDKLHKKIVDSFRGKYFGINGINLKYLGIDYKELDFYINEQINSNYKLSCIYKKFGIKNKKFWIRIVRPNKKDNNPPHKDSHIKTFYWVRDNINIYLPLAGSNKNSSLPLLPKSHLDNENQYLISSSPCYVNNVKFTVPCIVDRIGGIDMITPNPNKGEILIFTPHIIHGGGMNRNKDLTRVSLEMRFFA